MVKTRNGLTMFHAWRDLCGDLVCEPTVTVGYKRLTEKPVERYWVDRY
jgi:hypothetical protein